MPSSDASSCATVERELVFRTALTSIIDFERYGTATPEPASRLIALLAHWPYVPSDDVMLCGQDVATPYTPTDEELAELHAAADLASTVTTTTIENMSEVEEGRWQMFVNIPMLRPFLQAQELLKCSINAIWTQGQSRFERLPDPKPGLAFGLAYSNEVDSLLSRQFFVDLANDSGIRLTYSPVAILDMVYPAVLIDCKSAWESMKAAESEVALGAARALSMLAELSILSGVPFQHCVVLIATQGSFWKLYVAYQDLDDRAIVHIVPVLRSVLQIELERDRQRLAYMILRLKAWMLGPYRSKILEQLGSLQEHGLQPGVQLTPSRTFR